MNKYQIAIEETLRRVVEVEEETPGLAVSRAEDEYNEEKHVLSAEDFIGTDIALSSDDETVKRALEDTEFVEYVDSRFKEHSSSVPVEDKIRLAFGSFDNALYEFNEHKEETGRNHPQVYMLYRSDAWHSSSSMELVALFSSFANMMEYLRRKKKEFHLKASEPEEFKNNRQTQGRDENYLYESDYLDVLPDPGPERPPREQAFYDVTDEQMEEIVRETEQETRDRLRLGENESIDLENDRHSEIWWEEMEKTVVRHGVAYYEDE